jgi:hypothetical protein
MPSSWSDEGYATPSSTAREYSGTFNKLDAGMPRLFRHVNVGPFVLLLILYLGEEVDRAANDEEHAVGRAVGGKPVYGLRGAQREGEPYL